MSVKLKLKFYIHNTVSEMLNINVKKEIKCKRKFTIIDNLKTDVDSRLLKIRYFDTCVWNRLSLKTIFNIIVVSGNILPRASAPTISTKCSGTMPKAPRRSRKSAFIYHLIKLNNIRTFSAYSYIIASEIFSIRVYLKRNCYRC